MNLLPIEWIVIILSLAAGAAFAHWLVGGVL